MEINKIYKKIYTNYVNYNKKENSLDKEEILFFKDQFLQTSREKVLSNLSNKKDSDLSKVDKTGEKLFGSSGEGKFEYRGDAIDGAIIVKKDNTLVKVLKNGSIVKYSKLPASTSGFGTFVINERGEMFVPLNNGKILIYNVTGGNPIRTIDMGAKEVVWIPRHGKINGIDTYLVTNSDGVVRGWNSVGAKVIEVKGDEPLEVTPYIDSDGDFYNSSKKAVYAFSGNSRLWKVSTDGKPLFLFPAIWKDPKTGKKIVYFSTEEGSLYSVDSTKRGMLNWQFTADQMQSCPEVDNNGNVYIFGQHKVYAFEKDGSFKYSPIYLKGKILNRYPHNDGNTFFIGTDDALFTAIDKQTGTIKWQRKLKKPMAYWPVWIDNIIFVPTDTGVYIFDKKTGMQLRYVDFGATNVTWPHPDNLGRVFFATDDGKVHYLDAKTGMVIRESKIENDVIKGNSDEKKDKDNSENDNKVNKKLTNFDLNKDIDYYIVDDVNLSRTNKTKGSFFKSAKSDERIKSEIDKKVDNEEINYFKNYYLKLSEDKVKKKF